MVGGDWRLGLILCDFWTTADVFCCTASILNIAAIALDRYWLITLNVAYTHARRLPRRRACRLMAGFAWSAAAVISVAPLLGWRTGTSHSNQYRLAASLPKVIWEEGRVAALSHTYAVKSPLVTMARPKFAPKSTPCRGPSPKPHYLRHPWTRPTYDTKRHPDPIRRFSTVHWTDRRTDAQADARRRGGLITTAKVVGGRRSVYYAALASTDTVGQGFR